MTSSGSTSNAGGRRYWFQFPGQGYKLNTGHWAPFTPAPPQMMMPGPVNLYSRTTDMPRARRQVVVEHWEEKQYPILSKTARSVYVERRRKSTSKFRVALWDQLERISGSASHQTSSLRDVFERLLGRVNDDFRADFYGNVLSFQAKRGSQLYWHADHIFPYSRGGLTQLDNLQALHARANTAVKRAHIEASLDPRRMRTGKSTRQISKELQAVLESEGRGSVDESYERMITPTTSELNELEAQEAANVAWINAQEMRCDFCSQPAVAFGDLRFSSSAHAAAKLAIGSEIDDDDLPVDSDNIKQCCAIHLHHL